MNLKYAIFTYKSYSSGFKKKRLKFASYSIESMKIQKESFVSVTFA